MALIGPIAFPLLLVRHAVNGLEWAHCCQSDTLPMALSGPIAVCSPDMLVIALNGPIVALETDCQWSQVGPALLLSDADHGLKWAHYYSSGILLIVAATVWPSPSSSLSLPLLPSHDHYALSLLCDCRHRCCHGDVNQL
jgi:hypothetical protein